MHRLHPWWFACLLLLLTSPGLATDGVLEINQACAAQRGPAAGDDPGCFPGDLDGFPVTIVASGSYRLTSNLAPPDIDTTAIDSQTDHVSLDLAGFGIVFPGTGCIAGALCPQGSGDGIAGARFTAVSNGFVRNAGRRGIDLDDLAMVHRVRVDGSGLDGVRLGNGSVLTQSIVNSSGQFGGSLAFPTVFSHTMLRNNGRLDGAAFGDRSGGIPTIGNYCADLTCGPAPRARRYYLTQDTFAGDEALDACAEGFHVASIYEISETGALRYDTTLGRTDLDSGEGPPTDSNRFGWAFGDDLQSCSGFTNPNAAAVEYGATQLSLEDITGNPLAVSGGYLRRQVLCSQERPVWCIED
ncbi:MAG: hypothetical protein QNK05_23625 [Myxococcota bacterium]|nr:hypothetical protein [Myxococcota bacterium]